MIMIIFIIYDNAIIYDNGNIYSKKGCELQNKIIYNMKSRSLI